MLPATPGHTLPPALGKVCAECATGEGTPVIFVRIVNGCWFLFRGAIALVVVVALVIGVYLYFHLDNETRRAAQAVLNRHCTPMVAQVGGARFTPGVGVEMRDVRLFDPRTPDVAECVFRAEMVRVEGQFDIASLARGAPRIERVAVDSPQLTLIRRADGTWNWDEFRPPQGHGHPAPKVEVTGGSLRVSDASRAELGVLSIDEVRATISPSDDNSRAVRFAGAANGGQLGGVAVEGVVDTASGRFEAEADVQGLSLHENLIAAILPQSAFSREVARLRGVASARITGSRGEDGPIGWEVRFSIREGETQLRRVPGPLRAIAIDGECTPSGLSVSNATAHWGSGAIRMAANRTGWNADAPIAARVKIEGLQSKELPIGSLPGPARRFWARFRPEGIADVAAEARFDGEQWRPSATITVRNASFEDTEKFRYRLTAGRGRIDVNGGVSVEGSAAPPASDYESSPRNEPNVRVELTASAEGTPVRIATWLHSLDFRPRADRQRPMPLGWIEITSMGAPITPPLINALPEPEVIRLLDSLHPAGRVDVRWRADREDPDVLDPQIALDMRLADVSIRYDQFPYPLSRVNGWVRQRGKRWALTDFTARGPTPTTLVRASGELSPVGESKQLVLRFDGERAPLDQTLRNAVDNEVRQAWDSLAPRGEIDFTAVVSSTCTGSGPPQHPQVSLSLRPEGRVEIAPQFTPGGRRYSLSNLTGVFDWQDQRLTMSGARATHGATRYAWDGAWEKQSAGWRLVLNALHAQRLIFDQDFLRAAPSGMVGVLDTLRPRGAIDLYDSSFLVRVAPGQGTGFSARWDLGIHCHQTDLTAGVPLDGVSGRLRLVGSTDGRKIETTGEVDLDSVFWNDLQLTQVRGPLWADGAECLVGEGVARKTASPPRRLVARAYDGSVEINSHVRHDGAGNYGLSAQLAGVNVARLASEWMQRPESIGGRLDGRLEFQGAGPSISGLTGQGSVTINDADLYELPILARLLKVLRNRAPDDTAFDRCEARFTQRGDVIQFQQLDLLGNAFSLYGRGTATLSKQVDLTFGALVGRNELAVEMLKAFVSSASEQLMRVRVTGSLDAPSVAREALPIVGNMLDQLGPAAARPPAPFK